MYLREGGTLEFFDPDFPKDLAFGAHWTLVKRQALAAAMRRERPSGPLIDVRRVPLKGVPRHLHPGDEQHVDDHFTRGVERLGPLGYSLLRGHLLVREHLDLRVEMLRNAYEDLIAGVIGARADGVESPEWLYRERARLVSWDALGLLHQVSEQMASLFDARQRWARGDGDLGELMVRSRVQAWKTIQSSSYGSRVTWRRVLGIPGPSKAVSSLTREHRTLLAVVQERSEHLLMADIHGLRQVWTHDLHRAATRYKHSYPILSASHGVVWFGTDDQEMEIRRLVKAGALVVADTTSSDGPIEQLVLPVTIGGIEVLFEAVRSALQVASILVASLLSGAENPSRTILVVHPSLLASREVPVERYLDLIAAYTGAPPNPDVPDIQARLTSRHRIDAAAKRLRGHIPSGYWAPDSHGPPDESPP